MLKNENFTFQKLLEFVTENVPERFWSETQDDAKPDYLTSVIGPGSDGKGEERISHADITIHDFEKIQKEHLKRTLRAVYDARSGLVHDGVRFPESIVIGHFRNVPIRVLTEMSPLGDQAKRKPKIPPFLTFERLVSYSMVEFLRNSRRPLKEAKTMSSWWIDEPKFLGSSNPTTDELERLFQQGFRTIISLLDESEQRTDYDVKEVEAMGFQRLSIPVRDFAAPSQDQFRKFLEAVNQALDKGKVIMHCQGGSGRTGTMAVAYWINKGLTAKDAINKVRQCNRHAVEMPEQKESLYELEVFIMEEK